MEGVFLTQLSSKFGNLILTNCVGYKNYRFVSNMKITLHEVFVLSYQRKCCYKDLKLSWRLNFGEDLASIQTYK